MIKRIVSVCLFVSTAASHASYNNQLLIDTTDARLWQGQPSQLMVVSLGGGDSDNVLILPETDDFLITAGTPVKLNKGDESGMGYPVQLTPLNAGTLTLPSFLVQGSNASPSAEQFLNVKAPTLSDGMSIQVKRSAEEIYLGQSIRLEFEWITSLHPRSLKAVNILIPEMEHNVIKAIEPALDDRVLQKSALHNKPIGLPVGNRRITGRWEKLEEKRVRIFFDYVLQPTQSGTFEFPQPVLLASVDSKTLSYRRGEFKGMRYPPHFDNNFFDEVGNSDSRTVERVMAVGDPFNISVRSLPEGAPEHFSGMVGRPEISVQVDRQKVSQGDAVKVEFRVQHPDLEVVTLPSLKTVLAFNRVFDIPASPDPVSYEQGEKIIAQTVFPDDPGISQIPPLVVNYFDPDSGQYRDYITAPIPLEVTPVKQFNFSDSELPDDVQLINQLVPSDKGIWSHLWGQEFFNKQRLDDRQVWLLILFFVLLPPLIFFIRLTPVLHGVWLRRREKSPLAQFRLHIQSGNEPLTELGIYLSRRSGLSPAKLNVVGIRRHMVSLRVMPDTVDNLCGWLDQYQQQFAVASDPNSSELHNELLRIVAQIDHQLPDLSHTESTGAFL
ncbi:hypothetical protein ACH42_04580 [Endozoicomonas sp. (ex Bugula neritina AB1)]|nr:hypothetical protein ACH42_04580 [Endozoicomonas sp. (ex Bugula neritina AB1)]